MTKRVTLHNNLHGVVTHHAHFDFDVGSVGSGILATAHAAVVQEALDVPRGEEEEGDQESRQKRIVNHCLKRRRLCQKSTCGIRYAHTSSADVGPIFAKV